jgi:hypothetical protein
MFARDVDDKPQTEVVMAQWSEAAAKQRQWARLNQRLEMFKKFREAGWTIRAVSVTSDTLLPDNHPDQVIHFFVKMPGAHPARIKTWAQLERLVTGV